VIKSDRRAGTTLLTVCFVFVTTVGQSPSPRIIPLHTKVIFSRLSPARPWSAFVLNSYGKPVYKLFLDAQRNATGNLIVVDLVLTSAVKGNPDANLLNPQHNWHGLQPYSFVARDLAKGPDKSAFGRSRTIEGKAGNIVLQVEILNVRVTPMAEGDYQIEEIELSVEVKNKSA